MDPAIRTNRWTGSRPGGEAGHGMDAMTTSDRSTGTPFVPPGVVLDDRVRVTGRGAGGAPDLEHPRPRVEG